MDFRRQALTKLYSSFCGHSVLFCAGFFMLSNKGDVKRVMTDYYRYLMFLLYLPRSFRNGRLISKYQATDIVLSVEKQVQIYLMKRQSVLVLTIMLSASFAKLLYFFLIFVLFVFVFFCVLCFICSSLFVSL